jgi:hypothetical protein
VIFGVEFRWLTVKSSELFWTHQIVFLSCFESYNPGSKRNERAATAGLDVMENLAPFQESNIGHPD